MTTRPPRKRYESIYRKAWSPRQRAYVKWLRYRLSVMRRLLEDTFEHLIEMRRYDTLSRESQIQALGRGYDLIQRYQRFQKMGSKFEYRKKGKGEG